jgi:hypothetical protein
VRGTGYYEPKCRSWRLGFLCILLKSGRDLMPT